MRRITSYEPDKYPNSREEFNRIWREDMEQGLRQFDLYRFRGLMEGIPNPSRIIEIGAGCSEFLTFALNHHAPNGGIEAHALDFSDWAMSYMKQVDPRVRWTWGNALASPYPNGYFDAVMAGEIIEHLEEPHKLVEEMARLTRPGGFFRITTLLPHLQATDHWHVWEFEEGDLKGMFEKCAPTTVKVVGNYFIVTGHK